MKNPKRLTSLTLTWQITLPFWFSTPEPLSIYPKVTRYSPPQFRLHPFTPLHQLPQNQIPLPFSVPLPTCCIEKWTLCVCYFSFRIFRNSSNSNYELIRQYISKT